MKQALLDVLKVLDNEQVFVVKQLHYDDLNGGDLVWMSGSWCEYINCYLERTLYHVHYIKDGIRYHQALRQNTFLVRMD